MNLIDAFRTLQLRNLLNFQLIKVEAYCLGLIFFTKKFKELIKLL